LYIDQHLVALDKPAGLLAVPGRTEPDCLSARAAALWPDARIVHRLDQPTSGLFLLARGATMQRVLSDAFATRQVDKRYVAVVHGLLAEDSGQIDLPLAADWPNRPRQCVDVAAGKAAVTHWRVLSRDPAGPTTRLCLTPVTGRTHQLRVHLDAIGHAIVGDRLYGPPDDAARLLLHASALDLPHPASAERLSLRCPPPF
jgi:tRNA pseudouridine32 synthase/23S rRNA pseudouridine746 synthase